MIRTVVVDDQQLIRDLVRTKLESVPDIRVVAEASSGEEARRIVPSSGADVVVMDLSMPGIGGIEATRRLLNAIPHLKVVGLSVYVDGPFPAKFIAAGGIGYVSKSARPAELIEAVRRVARGEPYMSRDVAEAIIKNRSANIDCTNVLTDREMQVWKLLADGIDIADIAVQLKLSIKTVYSHRRNLMEKLNASNDVQLARFAREHGITP
ncbi:MAG: response regulator [Gammaproteobacteria bacterium]